MAVPKKRKSRSRRNERRSHDALADINFAVCQQCGAPTLLHKVCNECGYYRGRQVLKVKEEIVEQAEE